MNNILPILQVNGVNYELKKTRYLVAEYKRIGEGKEFSKEEQLATVDAQALFEDVKKYAKKLKTLEEKYFETFEEEDERKYFKMKEIYEEARKRYAEAEIESGGVSRKLEREAIDALEQIAIKAIAEQYFNMDIERATSIWTTFVEDKGDSYIIEWLLSMADCFFNEEEAKENDPFLSKVRAKNNNKKFLKNK